MRSRMVKRLCILLMGHILKIIKLLSDFAFFQIVPHLKCQFVIKKTLLSSSKINLQYIILLISMSSLKVFTEIFFIQSTIYFNYLDSVNENLITGVNSLYIHIFVIHFI